MTVITLNISEPKTSLHLNPSLDDVREIQVMAVVNFLTSMIIHFAAFQTSLFISKQDKLEVNYPSFSLNLLFSPERPSTFGLEALRRSLYDHSRPAILYSHRMNKLLVLSLLLIGGNVELNPGPPFSININTRGLKIVHLNIRSIICKMDSLKLLLKDKPVDILTV